MVLRKIAVVGIGLFACIPAMAENVSGVDKMLCSASKVRLCFETGECFEAAPWELDMPEFVIIDTKKKTISTTEASARNRSSSFSAFVRANDAIHLQGIENGRAFSFVVHESTGMLTGAIARDGLSVTVFGSCTDADM